jgi:iron complex transport system ATP-binding protein
MDPVLHLSHTSAYRGHTRLFADLSLTLPASTNSAILGPNGAGKTTLLMLLTREIYPPEGTVKVLGRERWNVWELRSHLGVVSQELQQHFVAHTSGIEVLLSGFSSSQRVWDTNSFSREQWDRAEEIMDWLEVGRLRERRFADMSAGEQRRFLLGRALVHDPQILVLDEPTSGLDLKACFAYLDLIRRLMRAGKTVVLVTHHIHEIPPEIDHLVMLKQGEVFAQGPKAELLTESSLASLYDTPLRLVQLDGFYQAFPRYGS